MTSNLLAAASSERFADCMNLYSDIGSSSSSSSARKPCGTRDGIADSAAIAELLLIWLALSVQGCSQRAAGEVRP